MVVNPDIKKALDFNLKGLLTPEKKEEFDLFLDSLDFEIKPIWMKYGIGFSNDKLYIDLKKCYWTDKKLGLNGDFTLMVLLHEIGHMKRLMADDKHLFKYIDIVINFEEYFETVLEEEEFAELFTEEKFEHFTGYPIPWAIKQNIPDVNSESYKYFMESVFIKKNDIGTWSEYVSEVEKVGDETYEWIKN